MTEPTSSRKSRTSSFEVERHVSGSPRRFWWLWHDNATYKWPVIDGKVLLAQDVLDPRRQPFELDVAELAYHFEDRRKDRRKIGDFSEAITGTFFVNEHAYEIFEDMFMEHGRMFPVRCGKETYYFVLIDTVMDGVLDLDRSEFRRLDMYPDLKRDAGMTLKIVLKRGFQSDADIFRTGVKDVKMDLVVSDAFKVRYERAGLTGLFFEDAGAD